MPPHAVQIDLEELQEIIDDLGIVPDGAEHRKNTLTQADVMIIFRIVKAVSHKECTRGLTADEVDKWKFVCDAFNKGILAVGWLIVAAVVGGLMRFFWWATNHGLIEITTKGKGA